TIGPHPEERPANAGARLEGRKTPISGRAADMLWVIAAALLFTAALALPAAADEAAKRGGILTYMIPADAPPSFDVHTESAFPPVHAFAPCYSLLVRSTPDNPASTTDIVCDLCSALPASSDDGKTWTFKLRPGVKFHDGSPLTAGDIAATFNAIAFP